jgi:hypothetical protein
MDFDIPALFLTMVGTGRVAPDHTDATFQV